MKQRKSSSASHPQPRGPGSLRMRILRTNRAILAHIDFKGTFQERHGRPSSSIPAPPPSQIRMSLPKRSEPNMTQPQKPQPKTMELLRNRYCICSCSCAGQCRSEPMVHPGNTLVRADVTGGPGKPMTLQSGPAPQLQPGGSRTDRKANGPAAPESPDPRKLGLP